jgi:hypothetical protein
MNKKHLLIFSLVTLNIILFISSCDSPAPNLEIPNASDVRKINVSLKGDTSSHNPLCVIKNTNQIKEILKFVHKHNNKWQYPTILPMPSLPYELEFSGSGRDSLLVIWLDDGKTNTLGGINEGDSRLKSLSSSELQEIITLIHTEPTCKHR